MLYYLSIAAGGALGALSRVWLATLIDTWTQTRFPFGTLSVNLIGSLLMGVCFVLIAERWAIAPEWRPLLVAGFLGAFTTFSAFSLDALLLMENGLLLQALAYVAGSVVFCILAAWTGMTLTRLW